MEVCPLQSKRHVSVRWLLIAVIASNINMRFAGEYVSDLDVSRNVS